MIIVSFITVSRRIYYNFLRSSIPSLVSLEESVVNSYDYLLLYYYLLKDPPRPLNLLPLVTIVVYFVLSFFLSCSNYLITIRFSPKVYEFGGLDEDSL